MRFSVGVFDSASGGRWPRCGRSHAVEARRWVTTATRKTVCASKKDQSSDDNGAFESIAGAMWGGGGQRGGWCSRSAPLAREHAHEPGRAEGHRGDHALRIAEEGRRDGVEELAGRTAAARRRAHRGRDQLELDWHGGGSLDGDRGRGWDAELRGRDAVDIDRDGQVVVVTVDDGHNRRGSWVP